MPKQAKKSAAKKPTAKKPATDWVAVLRSGEAGVRKWNRLTGAERAAAALARADLAGCDLTSANLNGVSAKGATFRGATLAGVRLDSADLTKVVFADAILRDANISHALAAGADFGGAVLTNAVFTHADLQKCSFANADLTGVRFESALLGGADFTGATLADVVWNAAAFDAKTLWPAGFTVPGELRWTGRTTDPRLGGKGKAAVAHDINGLMTRLHSVIDAKRMGRTLDMLKKGRNQIFHEVEPTLVRGIVRSQTDADKVYSCVLTEDGTYSCCTPAMEQCFGLSNEPCKHILVLLIGLARAGAIDPTTADKWAVAARAKNPRWNKTVQNHMADSLLKYKGAQAGDIDWRPTETIPEDYYAM